MNKEFNAITTSIERIDYYRNTLKELESKLPEDVTISESARNFAVSTSENIYQRYGNPNSPDYLAYHNDQHAIDVIRRGWQLLTIAYETLPERVKPKDFELLLVAAASHDYEQQKEEFGENEKASAKHATLYMGQSSEYDSNDMLDVRHAIIATTIHTDNGMLDQKNLRDPKTRSLVPLSLAMADINGIWMEGDETMVQNVIHLAAERIKGCGQGSETSSLFNLAQEQIGFLRERLKFAPLDLGAHLSEEELEKVAARCDIEFGDEMRKSFKMARVMRKLSPDFIEKIVESAGSKQVLQQMVTVALKGLAPIPNDSPYQDNKPATIM